MDPLAHLLAKVDNPDDLKIFLDVTLTEKELEMAEERWRIFKALKEGMTQRDAAKAAGASIATVTRGAKVYRKNKAKINTWLAYHPD